MQLGFIGLGVMGRPMALHLLRAGHSLAVWARRQAASQPLLAAGAQACASPAESRRAEVVFTVVTAGADVEQADVRRRMAWRRISPSGRCWST
jgi:2-hydroxy-3-oxopropionate reductase